MRRLFYGILFLISTFDLSAQTQYYNAFKLGDTTISYATICYVNSENVEFINVHENENTSVLAAKQFLEKEEKYCLTELHFKQQRFLTFQLSGKNYTVDPNRIYTDSGQVATLKKNGNYSDSALKTVSDLANYYVQTFIDGKKLIIAMHNNTDGEPLSINSYKVGGNFEKAAADIYINTSYDADDFFYTTEQKIFDFFKSKRFNVVLQNIKTVEDDGSLSVYCANKSIPYLNIEAQIGHQAEQLKMLQAVGEMLKP